ncbi:unnamed protein product [Echinostoma caproni]|uniref:CCHC-type domain-containing protein n=1 Tax=Echinostoma caproni TaxID=27848 RepID=A0A183BF32_9TREM|nr:unnamed protein product [Echinostoma caproni]
MEVNPWDVRPSIASSRSTKVRISCQEKLARKVKLNRDLASPVPLAPQAPSSAARRVLQKLNLDCTYPESEGKVVSDIPLASKTPLKETNGCVTQTIAPKIIMESDAPVVVYSHDLKCSQKCGRILSKHGSFLGKAIELDKFDVIASNSANNILPEDFNCFENASVESPEVPSVLETRDVEEPEFSEPLTEYTVARCTTTANKQPRTEISSKTQRSHPISTTRGFKAPTKNYLKLNLRKKCFSKKGAMRQRALQRQVRFAKFKRKFSSWNKEDTKCFRCGATGHWANKCPSTLMESKTPIEPGTNNRYASKLATAIWRILDAKELDKRYQPARLEDLNRGQGLTQQSKPNFENTVERFREQAYAMLNKMGFPEFRPGQELIIMRTLLGTSTLAVLPTAAGKSLCYQIPAAILQVLKLSAGLEGAYLNSSQSLAVKEEILENSRK